MKTKFILHGGFMKGNTSEYNEPFYSEILKDTQVPLSILIICFAQDVERVPQTFEKVLNEFKKVAYDKKLAFVLAEEKSFMTQLKHADIIYFNGGVTAKLVETLSQYKNIFKFLEGKVIVGESAGANALCRYGYSPAAKSFFEGLGILSICLIPHYTEEMNLNLSFLGLEKNIQTVMLPEYEFRVFEEE